jgi:hypothetical protein
VPLVRRHHRRTARLVPRPLLGDVTMTTFLVNSAGWDGPADLDPAWLIVNAPRPLLGDRTWQGQFRHGIFYAAMPATAPEGDEFRQRRHADVLRSWQADDAWQVEFIDDTEIERRCVARAREQYGYADRAALEADGITIDMLTEGLYPWCGGAS